METLHLYTAYHTEGKDAGVAFACLMEQKGSKIKRICTYHPTLTYLQSWTKGVADIVERLRIADVDAVGNNNIHIKLAVQHKNIYAIAKKLESVFRELRKYDGDLTDLIDRKMRKSNMSRYEYHDDMVKIMTTLLRYDAHTTFDFSIFNVPKKHETMRTAYQEASNRFNKERGALP